MSQTLEILLAFDRFANTLCGGNSLATISGRVGRFADETRLEGTPSWYDFNNYWLLCEQCINWGFIPLGHVEHCNVAFEKERNVLHNKSGGLRRFLLSVIIIVTMGILGSTTRIFNIIKEKYVSKFKNR